MVRPTLSDVCNVETVASEILQCGVSIGFKLRRVGVLHGIQDDELCAIAGHASKLQAGESEALAQGAVGAASLVSALESDMPDVVLRLAIAMRTGGGENAVGALNDMCWAAVGRNFFISASMLLERGADVQLVQVRRGRRRGLVDLAARGATNDDDWRLVKKLLCRGAQLFSPQGVLFAPLRRNDLPLVRELLALGVDPGSEGFVTLLCDVCSHNAMGAAALLIDELKVPVDARNSRDYSNCTDRAIAWHCWAIAEWLVRERGGSPTRIDTALYHLLDAASDPRVVRILTQLLASGAIGARSLMLEVTKRGDISLCDSLLASSLVTATSLNLDDLRGESFVDLALCHGHLRLARTLLQRGFRSKDVARARTDAVLHGGPEHAVANEILLLLPVNGSGYPDQLHMQPRIAAACAAECNRPSRPPSSPSLAASLAPGSCGAPGVHEMALALYQ